MSSDNDDMLRSNDGGVAVAGEFETVKHDEPAAADAPATNESRTETPMPSDLVHLPFAEARARALEQFDRQFLSAALARHNGNIARTARSLGLHRQSLQKLMARRNIKSVRPGPAATPNAKS